LKTKPLSCFPHNTKILQTISQPKIFKHLPIIILLTYLYLQQQKYDNAIYFSYSTKAHHRTK